MNGKHTVWWTTEEAAHTVKILNQLMEKANTGDLDQHISPALGIAIDAIQVLEYAIKHASPSTSLEVQDIVADGQHSVG